MISELSANPHELWSWMCWCMVKYNCSLLFIFVGDISYDIKKIKPFWQFYNFERNDVPRVEVELESFPTARFVKVSYYYQFVYPRFIPSCYKKTHTWIKSSIPMSLSPWIAYCFFSCDQAALWMAQSVRLSVCLSVCDTFFTMFPSLYHHGNFWSYYQWQKWCPWKRSRSEVKGQGHRGHNPT